jgi:hypothetical protein
MSSIRFIKERLNSSVQSVTLERTREHELFGLTERLHQRMVKLDSVIQSLHGNEQNPELSHRLKIARRFMESGEWGACQFELDCLESELN